MVNNLRGQQLIGGFINKQKSSTVTGKQKFFFFLIFIYLFWGCVRSQLWHAGSFVAVRGLLSQLWHAGSRARGLCICGAWAQLSRAGLAAPRHVVSQFPDQGSNQRPLHCKMDSQPLDHQGSPQTTSSYSSCLCVPQRVKSSLAEVMFIKLI